MGTLEFLRENVGKFFMYGGERCRLVGIEDLKGVPNPCLVIEKKNGWPATPGRFVQMWGGKIEMAWYATEEQLIPDLNVSARQFAEDNAGRYYTFDEDGTRVRVVGYHSDGMAVIVTYRGGWRGLDYLDNITCKTKATSFMYAAVSSLKEIPLC